MLFVFIGIESSVLFVGLLYISFIVISFIVDVNKEKNLIDQRASLRVDTRETQQDSSRLSTSVLKSCISIALIFREIIVLFSLTGFLNNMSKEITLPSLMRPPLKPQELVRFFPPPEVLLATEVRKKRL